MDIVGGLDKKRFEVGANGLYNHSRSGKLNQVNLQKVMEEEVEMQKWRQGEYEKFIKGYSITRKELLQIIFWAVIHNLVYLVLVLTGILVIYILIIKQ